MNRVLVRLLMAAALAAGAVAVPAAGADDKPAAKKPAAKKPADAKPADWSNYAAAGELVGEVVKAGEDGLTLRLPKRGSGKGAKDHHDDHDLKYADGGLARWKKLPAKVGADGKKATYSQKEMDALRQPTGAPGYAAERTDVQAGQIVEVKLVRPKTIPAAKATPDDLLVKYAVIVGEAPHAAKAEKKDDPPKKKKDK